MRATASHHSMGNSSSKRHKKVNFNVATGPRNLNQKRIRTDEVRDNKEIYCRYSIDFGK